MGSKGKCLKLGGKNPEAGDWRREAAHKEYHLSGLLRYARNDGSSFVIASRDQRRGDPAGLLCNRRTRSVGDKNHAQLGPLTQSCKIA